MTRRQQLSLGVSCAKKLENCFTTSSWTSFSLQFSTNSLIMASMLSFFALIMAVVATSLVQASRAPVYVFTGEGIGIGCTEAEWNTVLLVMGNATKDRRHLGVRGSHQRRQLSCPAWCGKYCAMMGIGCASGGRRRQQRTLQNGYANAYGRGNGTTFINGDVSACADDMTAIDTALASFSAPSNPCQKLLAGDKTISCPDFTTTDCYIRGLSAWDTKPSNTAPALLIPKMTATGTSFCQKTELALRVDTNFVVGKVTMSLYFTKSLATPMKLDKVYEGGSSPYYVFGSKPLKLKDDTMGIQVDSKKMDSIGWYTLNVVAVDNPNNVKTWSFAVSKC
jgi:hypothetical protein